MKNTDGCTEQYRCASALYLISVMSQCYSIIIDLGISAHGHGIEVLNELNVVDKCYIYQLMSTVQLPGSIIFDPQIKMHTGTKKEDVNLAKEFQEHLTKITAKMVSLIKENEKEVHGKKMDRQRVSYSG